MTNVIVAFSNLENAKNIRNALLKNGYEVAAVCTSGAQTIKQADELGSGIVVCGSRFADMVYQELYECLPPEMRMLLVASPAGMGGDLMEGIVCLGLPLKVHDLISTIEMMSGEGMRRRRKAKMQRKERSREEEDLISQAKDLLMERNRMTESDAHRYIQKCSMDSGTNMVETAQMIMSLFHM